MSLASRLVSRWTLRQWTVFGLTTLMLACLPLVLRTTEWLHAVSVLWWATLWGSVGGLVLARVVRRPSVATSAMLVSGLLFIVAFESRALPPPGPAVGEVAMLWRWAETRLIEVTSEAFDPALEIVTPSTPPVLSEWNAAWERLLLYGWNLQTDWSLMLDSQWLASGQILLGSILGLLAWTLAAVTVWGLRGRRSAWSALTPLLTLVAIGAYHNSDALGYLVICVVAGLLLVGHTSLSRLEAKWQMRFPDGITLDWWAWSGLLAILVGAAMMLTAWVTDLDLGERGTTGTGPGSTRDEGQSSLGVWPRQHLLGTGPELTGQLVMVVSTPGVERARFYWRATSYDEYTGRGWVRNATRNPNPGPGTLWPQSLDPPSQMALLRQDVRLEHPSSQIYAAGRPVSLSVPAKGVWHDEAGLDLVSVRSVTPQSAYQVLSWVPIATQDDLRMAREDYPEWVEESYLALPAEVSDRVVELAQEITADGPTPYDKARALQGYLRTYEYSLELTAPPDDRDVVDYFLFDLQQGYCDYYASAMVVMARAVNMPARLAVGYATGEYNVERGVYQVTRADAHSWAEVYFPGYGWIAFEPTAALPATEHESLEELAVVLAEGEGASALDGSFASGEYSVIGRRGRIWPLAAATMAMAAIGGGAALTLHLKTRKARRGTPSQIVTSLYAQLLRQGWRLGVPPSNTQTPDEFLSTLTRELTARAECSPGWGGNWDVRLEQVRLAAKELVTLYTDGRYGPRQPTREMAEGALAAWPQLNRALWAFRLISKKKREGDATAGI